MAYAFISGNTKGSTGGNAVTSDAIDTTGANLLVVSVSAYSVTPGSITDSKGNTWTALTASTSTTSRERLFYCVPTSVGSGHTFTYSQSGTFPVIGVRAFSGAHATPLDQQAAGGSTGSGTSLQPGSLTPPGDGYLFVSGIIHGETGGTALLINSGFTSVGVNYSSSNNIAGGMGYLIQTSAAAVNPTWSWTSTQRAAAVMATFVPAAGGTFIPGVVHHRKQQKAA